MPIHGLPPNQPRAYPNHFSLESAIRPNILALHPYRCARDDYSEGILLDANENALGHAIIPSETSLDSGKNTNGELAEALNKTLTLPLHRYPSPTHVPIKQRIAELRFLPSTDYVFLGVGSDEVLDLLIRVFVKPGVEGEKLDKILTTPPTYGMYGVCAQVNDVASVKVPLRVTPPASGEAFGEGGKTGRFSLDVPAIKAAILHEQSVLGNTIKLLFLCSPGNPTGTLLDLDSIKELLEWEEFKGVAIIDEAYIDFVGDENEDEKEQWKKSGASLVEKYSNVVVTQTLSKSFGLAGIRLGIALAQPPIVQVLSNTKAPYNVSLPTAHLAEQALSPASLDLWRKNVQILKRNRTTLIKGLEDLAKSATLKNGEGPLGVGEIIGSNDANFILVRILERPTTSGAPLKPSSERANKVYKALAEEMGVVVRYRGNELGCDGGLRITVGTEEENREVLRRLEEALQRL
ncbi:histidinol-phosphate transaminase [Coprinopsis cinerea okayama7|uniref:histidinol-phosphate transaminase n=1 Tax=Coprinopsis cinerea (strain Okayama-7 / 130 / ATCC MYA-4618 / FGSC 9003) TaxID=240176 RepID=A8PCL5_COPC7|nr:histidinol-phosphate transaminase [Coprinopsis cinerea okayama7\|eukprot:XP_001840428.1 histidinol-phosphate transaminase [Coprinopsis cinerea okayama7\